MLCGREINRLACWTVVEGLLRARIDKEKDKGVGRDTKE